MIPRASILEAMQHEELWRPWFRDLDSFGPWRVFLAALFGLAIEDEADLALYRQCTGRSFPPAGGTREAWLAVGRRGGKSLILSLIACYVSVFRDWRPYLVPGEVATVKVIATDRRQAGVIFSYCRALLSVPVLAELVEGYDGDEIRLKSGIRIEVQTANFRAVRGYTIITALLDEIAFWRAEESANPDREILNALRPAMATVPGAMLLAGSSPYARRGELWTAYRRYFGKDDAPALIWQAATRVMNPTITEGFIAAEVERDAESAAAEYGAQFRSDLSDFVQRAAVEACVAHGRFELPPLSRGVSYRGFVDTSGGGADSFTLGIGHYDARAGRSVLDAVREVRPPFSPAAVVAEFAQLLKSYGVREVTGDRYGGEFPRELFREHSITYVVSERTKSDIYLEFLPLLNSGKVELLDHGRLIGQLCGLERRTARSGKDSIDHGPGGHDDLVNAGAGALVLAAGTDPLGVWGVLVRQEQPQAQPAKIYEQPACDGMVWCLPRQVPFIFIDFWFKTPGWQVAPQEIVESIWASQKNSPGAWLADIWPRERTQ